MPRARTSEIGFITTPWNYQFDIRLDKKFTFGNFNLSGYFYIQNIFNRKNITHVYWRTGSAEDDGTFDRFPITRTYIENNYGKEFSVLYDLINHGHRQHYQVRQGGDLYGRPREIRFGIEITVK